MPWLTPETLPDDKDCRPVLIPASSEWLAIVSGALTELTQKWNWQQDGAVTVDEAVAAMQTMVNAYYEGCAACRTQPSGLRIVRIAADGTLEEVGEDGDWQPATGDYAFPPVPAREGGTAADQICLAATNAENVLHQVYEQLADYFASELSPVEGLTALAIWLLEHFAIAEATIIFAIVDLMLPVFALVWGALAYLTVDLWDENFTQAFICMLIDCASNTEGVVTFDWDCIEHALYAAAVTFEISEVQLRLYAQINYIIWTLGGIEALNTMGATTEITEADCSACSPIGCTGVYDFTLGEQLDWYISTAEQTGVGTQGTWVGDGFMSQNPSGFGADAALAISINCVNPVVDSVNVYYDAGGGVEGSGVLYLYAMRVDGSETTLLVNTTFTDGVSSRRFDALGWTPSGDWTLVIFVTTGGGALVTVKITKVELNEPPP